LNTVCFDFHLWAKELKTHAHPLQDIRRKFIHITHCKDIKNDLKQHPYSLLVLIGFEDLICCWDVSTWCSFLEEHLKCLLNIVDAWSLAYCLVVQTIQQIKLGLMKVEQLTQKNTTLYFFYNVVNRQELS